MIAADLVAWTRMLACTGEAVRDVLRKAEF
jgi:hypothetical protein